MERVKIKEIFESIQGEGPVVGYKQLFIRFCSCNLKCKYCDTDFLPDGLTKTFSPEDLSEFIRSKYDMKRIHSISLTGGEPLLFADFLTKFLPYVKDESKIYLETNATLPKELIKVKKYVDIISADIKLESSTGIDTFNRHVEFFEEAKGIYTFAKIVFDKNITQNEIEKISQIGKRFNLELILQPKMVDDKMSVDSIFCVEVLNKVAEKYPKVRLIPQVHKFLNIQ